MVPLSAFAARPTGGAPLIAPHSEPPFPLFPSSFAPPSSKYPQTHLHKEEESGPGITKRFLKWVSRKISTSVAPATDSPKPSKHSSEEDRDRPLAVSGAQWGAGGTKTATDNPHWGADDNSHSDLLPVSPTGALRTSVRRRARMGSFTAQYPALKGMYSVRETIGTGGFAKVKRAVHLLTGEKCAVKIMDKKSLGDDLPRIYLEIEAMKNLSHQHICKIFQVIETQDQIFMVLEHCPNGELFDYIVARDKLTENEARQFFRQIVSALGFMHRQGFVHRDLKPENLLLDKNHKLKLIDFGLCAKTSNKDLKLKTCCGSPAYAAPELIMGKEYMGPEADVWSLGVLLFAILCGYLPFDDDNISNLYKKIQSGRYTVPDSLSPTCADLISNLLQVDPKKRLSMDQLLLHPWLTKSFTCSVPWESQCPRDDIDLDCASELAFHSSRTRKEVIAKLKNWKFDYLTATYMLLLQKKNSGKTARLMPSAAVDYPSHASARDAAVSSRQSTFALKTARTTRARYSSYVQHHDLPTPNHVVLPVTISSASSSIATNPSETSVYLSAKNVTKKPESQLNGEREDFKVSTVTSAKTSTVSSAKVASKIPSVVPPATATAAKGDALTTKTTKADCVSSDGRAALRPATTTATTTTATGPATPKSETNKSTANATPTGSGRTIAASTTSVDASKSSAATSKTGTSAASKDAATGSPKTSSPCTVTVRTFRAGSLRVGRIAYADDDF